MQMKNLAKSLKITSTIPEKIFWSILRNRRLNHFKFKRQIIIGHYIVDFICLKHGLIIELDGSQHNKNTNQAKDMIRTQWLEKRGFTVIRFWNNELINNKVGVLDKIIKTLGALPGNYPGRRK